MKGALVVTAFVTLFSGTGSAQTTAPVDADRRLYEKAVWDELQNSGNIPEFVCRLHRLSSVSNIQYNSHLLLTTEPPRQRLSFDMAQRHYQFLLSSEFARPHVVVVSAKRSDLLWWTSNERR